MQIELSLNIKEPSYFRWANIQNRFHRRKGKSYTEWHSNGQKDRERYYINGDLHNAEGPATTSWYFNGQKHHKEYYINGKRHNTKGPAFIDWHENGQKHYEDYYINGRLLTKGEWEECK